MNLEMHVFLKLNKLWAGRRHDMPRPSPPFVGAPCGLRVEEWTRSVSWPDVVQGD